MMILNLLIQKLTLVKLDMFDVINVSFFFLFMIFVVC